jgi:hypothetical protein
MLEAYFYPEGEDERPEAEDILEMATKMVCAEPDNEGLAPVVRSLLRAFARLRSVERDEDEEVAGAMLTGKEAEALFYKVYFPLYCKAHTRRCKSSKYGAGLHIHKDTPEDREYVLEGADCPDALGHREDFDYCTSPIFPRGFVCTIARCITQRDAVRSVMLAEYYLDHRDTETTARV